MNPTGPFKRLLRSVGAVLAGLVTIVVLSMATDIVMYAVGILQEGDPPMAEALWLIPTGYRLAFGILGCWLAARLAPGRPMGHAFALGIIGLLVGAVGFVATQGREDIGGPAWYPIAVMLMPVPCALLGGWLGRGHDGPPTSPPSSALPVRR